VTDQLDRSGSEAPPSSASLLYGVRRFPVPSGGVSIGRAEDNDVVLPSTRASRNHARVYRNQKGEFVLADLGSRHGTELNDATLRDEQHVLRSGDSIVIDGEILRFLAGPETRVETEDRPMLGPRVVRLEGDRLTIGRDPSNDVVLPDPNVSRFHAEVVTRDGQLELVDLDSRNGTRLDGQAVVERALERGSEVRIGPYRLTFDGTAIVTDDESGAMRLDARGLVIEVHEKRILDDVSITIEPGEFVAVIGESGSGKSTLIKALAGVSLPTNGDVTVNDEPVTMRLTDVGYVPQDEIVHAELSVREALEYAARLRLPADTSAAEITKTVERVLGEVALEEHAETRIGSLSGGQRKRTGVASELLGRPSLLFLDEPTTGLDPGLESKMMALLRELANQSRAVVVVTHATKNLGLCDKVAVMGRGGYLTYYGSPAGACDFFEVTDYDGVYEALERRPAQEWRALFEPKRDKEPGAAARVAASSRRRSRSLRRWIGQTRTLTARYLKVFLRDRRNLALLLGQVPVLGVANGVLFQSGLFDRPVGRPGDAAQLLFLMAIVVAWLGAIDASREIVKERGVLHREAAAGVRLSAYFASKALVLFALVATQTLIFAAVVLAFRPIHASAGDYAMLLALLVATGFVAVSMGLTISAFVSTEDQATSLTPLAVIPQLLFAGAIVPVHRMGPIVKEIPYAMFSQWSFAGVGTTAHMNGRIAENPKYSQVNPFGTHFFDVPFGTTLLVLGLFLAAFSACTMALLSRSVRR
jgi:ABC transport system ATP-binding/permease protein